MRRELLVVSFLLTSAVALLVSHGATAPVYEPSLIVSCDNGLLTIENISDHYVKVLLIVEGEREPTKVREGPLLSPYSEVKVKVTGPNVALVLNRGPVIKTSCP